jgi:hypothetical protein
MKPKIGIYTMGLAAYWNQFPGLRERLLEYGNFIAKKVEELGLRLPSTVLWIVPKPDSHVAIFSKKKT